MTKDDVKSVGSELPKEMARVRDKVIPAYESIGPAGQFAITWMKAALDKAAKAMAEGDTIGMIQAYEELRGAKV